MIGWLAISESFTRNDDALERVWNRKHGLMSIKYCSFGFETKAIWRVYYPPTLYLHWAGSTVQILQGFNDVLLWLYTWRSTRCMWLGGQLFAAYWLIRSPLYWRFVHDLLSRRGNGSFLCALLLPLCNTFVKWELISNCSQYWAWFLVETMLY